MSLSFRILVAARIRHVPPGLGQHFRKFVQLRD
jgi:hypothetical protein